jgi:lipopolysaccharide transport system ATP-binding protein
MSSEPAVRVRSLSKCYQIYGRPQDRLKQSIYPRVQRLTGRSPRQYFKEFWALRDVSFEVGKGETLGVIGRNGSGKSTLLQLVCGTLNPSGGEIETRGRVGALLELGAGFNPEFTGRENVHLSACLHGLSKQLVEDRFDRIAAFADIGRYMDQPVKFYSSGMYVRLAFAVIAHIDADILVVDEALAVGDAVFVQRCMRFIRGFQERGTLLFVSHDMGPVLTLCRRCLWLEQGRVARIGPAKSVAEAYLHSTLQEVYGESVKLEAIDTENSEPDTGCSAPTREMMAEEVPDYGTVAEVRDNLGGAHGWSSGGAQILEVRLNRVGPGTSEVFEGGERVCLSIRARANREIRRPILGFLVRDRLGQDLFGENTLPFTNANPVAVDAGQEFEGRFVFRLPMLPNGHYAVMTSVAEGDLIDHVQHHWLHDAMFFHISSSAVRWGLVGIPFEQVLLKEIQ